MCFRHLISVVSFLMELRNIAINRRLLPQHLVMFMKRKPILLASRRTKKDSKKASTEFDEEDDWDLEYDLLKPDSIVIADETNAYQLFGDVVFAAPQDDLLEGWHTHYSQMNCKAYEYCRFLHGTWFATAEHASQREVQDQC